MTRCPICDWPDVIVCGNRAWCGRPYANGSCCSFFRLQKGKWVRDPDYLPLFWVEPIFV